MKRSLTGIQPSGTVHIGNYLGMLKPSVSKQSEYQCLYFIADMHSLTSRSDPKLLRQASYDIVATWIACGLDIKKHILYRQSDIAAVTEFAWYLSCVTGVGLLLKAHAYKDAVAKNQEVNHGVLAYPVLMAADILMYDVDIVPVGKDQKQHVEMARDMAQSFNAVYGEGLIKLPEPKIEESVMTIPGLDGRKMSKSYDNTIPLFAEEKALKKLVMGIKTDSTPLEQPKSMKDSLVGQLYTLFATPAEFSDLEARLNKGGLGWGHAKEELFNMIDREVKAPREEYRKLRADESCLESVLKDGARRAKEISDPILNRVREAVGFAKH